MKFASSECDKATITEAVFKPVIVVHCTVCIEQPVKIRNLFQFSLVMVRSNEKFVQFSLFCEYFALICVFVFGWVAQFSSLAFHWPLHVISAFETQPY